MTKIYTNHDAMTAIKRAGARRTDARYKMPMTDDHKQRLRQWLVANAPRHGVEVTLEPGDILSIKCVTPAPVGRPRGEVRQRIEAIPPGLFDSFDLNEYNADSIKTIVQSIQRKSTKRFSVEVNRKDAVAMVNRTDSLEQASEAVREAYLRHAKAQEDKRYPFDRLEVGQSHLMPGEGSAENARSAAQYHKRKYNKTFTVNKEANGVLITRVT